MVSGDTGRLEFTDHTACRISFTNLSVPARSLRIMNVTWRMAFGCPAEAFTEADIVGQYTIEGAGSFRPFSRTSCTTPMTSCGVTPRSWRSDLPSAADGVRQSSRARLSEIVTTGLRP